MARHPGQGEPHRRGRRHRAGAGAAPGPAPAPAPAPAAPVATPKWQFYQGVDSNFGDIDSNPSMPGDQPYTGNLAQLKQTCLSIPSCKGFNDNGWLKSTLQPRSDWDNYRWTSDPTKGFRVVYGRTNPMPAGGVPEMS